MDKRYSLVRPSQNRTAGNRSSSLPIIELLLSRKNQNGNSQLASQRRTRVRQQLQTLAKRIRLSQASEKYRHCQASEMQVPGQPRIHLMAETDFASQWPTHRQLQPCLGKTKSDFKLLERQSKTLWQ